MSRKILVLVSSPRKGGNSEMLGDEFIKGARDAGREVEKLSLADKKIGYCSAYYACRGAGKPAMKQAYEMGEKA
jgi:multimeric flavodoxin WrbA